MAQEGDFALATQHGWDLDLVNEAGASAKAWADRPGHILVGALARGRDLLADGMTFQFERGAVWQRHGPAIGARGAV